MKIEHIKYFLAMQDSPSLSQAACKANISQQGYGKVIAGLEEALGCRLVERDALGARLTDAGHLFMEHARVIASEYQKMQMRLSTRDADHKLLKEFSGSMAFSNVCMNTFDPLFSTAGLLNHAQKEELSLSEALSRAENPRWICICDVCEEIYPHHADTWDIEVIGRGRVGIIVPQKIMDETGARSAEDVVKGSNLAIFDCEATREMYDKLFDEKFRDHLMLRTTRDNLLQGGLKRGDFALLSDSFHWNTFQSKSMNEDRALVFMPFSDEFHSIFGIVRAKGVVYDEEQKAVVDAVKRFITYATK